MESTATTFLSPFKEFIFMTLMPYNGMETFLS
jgi:hypothetical protein